MFSVLAALLMQHYELINDVFTFYPPPPPFPQTVILLGLELVEFLTVQPLRKKYFSN